VAWFGIVRAVRAPAPGRTELLLEHKYFDGFTDAHLLALSFNGAGDFKAALNTPVVNPKGGKKAKGGNEQATNSPIQPLMLVRVYGVVREARDAIPTVDVEYARAFPWKTFTFIDCYGKDATNPQWRKLCKAPLDHIYDSQPDDDYYRQRLGSETGEGGEKQAESR